MVIHVCVLGLLFANTSFSLCTDSSHELRDLQHFMSEQTDLHVFKVITAASCVDIIVNKCLNKYN